MVKSGDTLNIDYVEPRIRDFRSHYDYQTTCHSEPDFASSKRLPHA